MVICLERGAHLHIAQLMPLPLTVSCFSKIQTGFTFLVPAHLGSPGKGPLNGCVCECDDDRNDGLMMAGSVAEPEDRATGERRGSGMPLIPVPIKGGR